MCGEVPGKSRFSTVPPLLLLPPHAYSSVFFLNQQQGKLLQFFGGGGRCKMSDYRFSISLVWEGMGGESWGIFFYVTANYACLEQDMGKKENTKELHWIVIWRWWSVTLTLRYKTGDFFSNSGIFPLHTFSANETFSSTLYPLLRFAGNVATVSLSSLESRICHGRSNFPDFPQSSFHHRLSLSLSQTVPRGRSIRAE